MKDTWIERLRGRLSPNPEQYWWELATDEERELLRTDTKGLAKELAEIRNSGPSDKIARGILIEHLLNMRLARIQSKAAWGSGALGFGGALLGAALSFGLGHWFSGVNPPQVTCHCTQATDPSESHDRTGKRLPGE